MCAPGDIFLAGDLRLADVRGCFFSELVSLAVLTKKRNAIVTKTSAISTIRRRMAQIFCCCGI